MQLVVPIGYGVWVWCDMTLSIIKLLTVRSWRSDANTVLLTFGQYYSKLRPQYITLVHEDASPLCVRWCSGFTAHVGIILLKLQSVYIPEFPSSSGSFLSLCVFRLVC